MGKRTPVQTLDRSLASAVALVCITVGALGCGPESDLFGGTTSATGGGGGSAGSGGAGGSGAADVVRVAVMDGAAITGELRDFLDGESGIDAAVLNACILGELMAFDVVVVHGQMTCYEADDFNTYVVNGGAIVGVPWIHDYGQLAALPVTPEVVHKETATALEIFPTEPDDPLLEGVEFQDGDLVAYERGALPPRPEAVVSARWGDSSNTSAVVRWDHEQGRAVFLNFLYANECCPTAVQYGWGQTLVRNAVLWAAGD